MYQHKEKSQTYIGPVWPMFPSKAMWVSAYTVNRVEGYPVPGQPTM